MNNYFSICGINVDDFKITKVKNYNANINTMFQIASCSKFLTGLIVAKFYELDLIDYDTDVNKYLKKWKCPVKGITLRILLNHTSGTGDRNGYMGFEQNTKFHQDLRLNMAILNGHTPSKAVNFTEKPGTKFIYSGAGFQLIQQVLEEISGKRLYQLMDKYIFKVLGLRNSTGKLLYPGKHKYNLANMNNLYRIYPETAAAGVWMSVSDLVKLAMDLCKSYKNDTGLFLKQATSQLMLTKSKITPYGLGMIVCTDEKNNLVFSHDGWNYGYKMDFRCTPAEGKCEIIMINYNPSKISGDVIKKTKKLLGV